MRESKVLDYGDVLLRREDVDLLRGPHWLNDQVGCIQKNPARRSSHLYTLLHHYLSTLDHGRVQQLILQRAPV